jgi:hypothetical protein
MKRMLLREIEGRLKVHPMALPSTPSLLNAPRLIGVEAAVVQFIFVRIGKT